MSESENTFEIVRQSAEEFNRGCNAGFSFQHDFTQVPARMDWRNGGLEIFINTDVVPGILEPYVVEHERVELRTRRRVNEYDLEAHRQAIVAEYAAAHRDGKLDEQHRFLTGLVERDIQECEENGWSELAEERRNALAYREQIYRDTIGGSGST